MRALVETPCCRCRPVRCPPATDKPTHSLFLQDEEEGKEQEEFKLRIAWQYRRYIKTGQPGGATSAGGSGLGMGSSGSAGSSGSSSRAAAVSPAKGSSAGAAPRRPVGLRDWCHQFDLLRSAGAEGLQQCRAQLVDCSSAASSSSDCSGGSRPAYEGSTGRLLGAAADFVQALQAPQAAEAAQPAPAAGAAIGARAPAAASLPPRQPQHVGRIAVLSLGSLGWQLQPEEVLQPYGSLGSNTSSGGSGIPQGTAVLRALLQLKALVRDRRCAAAVSVPAALFSPSDVARMQHIADCVIALESVADGSDIVRCASGLNARRCFRTTVAEQWDGAQAGLMRPGRESISMRMHTAHSLLHDVFACQACYALVQQQLPRHAPLHTAGWPPIRPAWQACCTCESCPPLAPLLRLLLRLLFT